MRAGLNYHALRIFFGDNAAQIVGSLIFNEGFDRVSKTPRAGNIAEAADFMKRTAEQLAETIESPAQREKLYAELWRHYEQLGFLEAQRHNPQTPATKTARNRAVERPAHKPDR